MKQNIVYVTTDLQDSKLWTNKLKLSNLYWLDELEKNDHGYTVRTRYRAPLIKIESIESLNKTLILNLDSDVRAVTPGQSAVIYKGEQLVGSGIVV